MTTVMSQIYLRFLSLNKSQGEDTVRRKKGHLTEECLKKMFFFFYGINFKMKNSNVSGSEDRQDVWSEGCLPLLVFERLVLTVNF